MQKQEFVFNNQLNNEFLISVYDGDIEHAQVVFEQFIKVAPVQVEEIENCYCNNELELFRQKIHKLKPVFSFVGLTKMTEDAEDLERSCSSVSNVSELKEKYELFKINYKKGFTLIELEISNMNNFIQVL